MFETSLSRNSVALCYDALRNLIVDFMKHVSASTKLRGRGALSALTRPTLLARRKGGGGFRGRTTRGHETILLSGFPHSQAALNSICKIGELLNLKS